MKWISTLLLWMAACVLAAAVAYRLWRGRPILLARRDPRLLRMAVSLLVMLGVGMNEVRSEGGGGSSPTEDGHGSTDEAILALPEVLRREETIRAWRGLISEEEDVGLTAFVRDVEESDGSAVRIEGEIEERDEAFNRLRVSARIFPEDFRSLLVEDLDAIAQRRPRPALRAVSVLESLDVLERDGFIHPWVVRYLWGRLPQLPEEDRERLPEVLGRLRRHARMHGALVAASFGIRPFNPRAWMSKAGPRPEDRQAEEEAVGRILRTLAAAYVEADAGTWDRDARVRLEVSGTAACRIVRGGVARDAAPGERVDLDRLTLLRTTDPVLLDHPWVGMLQVPGDRVVHVWDLPDLLSEDSRETVGEVVDAALAGSEEEAERIELVLPLVHGILRDRLRDRPEAPGAPRLRLILELFDR